MSINKFTISTVLIVLLFLGITLAKDGPEALKVGSTAPDFQGTDQFGEKFMLEKQLEKGPVVLIFYRGHWCKYCNKHLAELEESIDQIIDKGASVVTVTPETTEFVGETSSKYNNSFRIISDKEMKIMNAYNVSYSVDDELLKKFKNWGIDLKESNGENGANLPIPATYIIGKDKKIKYAFFDEDYKNRPSMETILNQL